MGYHPLGRSETRAFGNRGEAVFLTATAIAILVGGYLAANATESDTVAMISPIHLLASGIAGAEPFSGRRISTGEAHFRIAIGALGVFAGGAALARAGVAGVGALVSRFVAGSRIGQAGSALSAGQAAAEGLEAGVTALHGVSTGNPVEATLGLLGISGSLDDVARATRGGAISRQITAAASDEADELIRLYGRRATGDVVDEITETARGLGFEGDVIVLQGAGTGRAGAGITSAGELLVFEDAFVKGLTLDFGRLGGRIFNGPALLAHEVGHTLAPISASEELLRGSRYWLREAQASALGATRPGLDRATRELLLEDYICAMWRYRRAGSMGQ